MAQHVPPVSNTKSLGQRYSLHDQIASLDVYDHKRSPYNFDSRPSVRKEKEPYLMFMGQHKSSCRSFNAISSHMTKDQDRISSFTSKAHRSKQTVKTPDIMQATTHLPDLTRSSLPCLLRARGNLSGLAGVCVYRTLPYLSDRSKYYFSRVLFLQDEIFAPACIEIHPPHHFVPDIFVSKR
ncbi:hypothetical protein BDV97DRAFT_82025 [Delphinella strobiligena]|nr:hypothetical protein BDV97DRAFT_82025 [Delphinella strobiligena]